MAEKINKPGKSFKSQARQIIFNVRTFFDDENKGKLSVANDNIVLKTALATGVSERTVKRFTAQAMEAKESGRLITTPKKKNRIRPVLDEFNDFDLTIIRNMIHDFYLKK